MGVVRTGPVAGLHLTGLVAAILKNVAHMAVFVGADLQGHGTARFQPGLAVTLGQ